MVTDTGSRPETSMPTPGDTGSSLLELCTEPIDAVQQRLASKIKVLWNDKAAWRAAPGTLLRRSAARPVEMVSLIRVAAISSGDRGAAVTRPVESGR